MIPRNKDTTPTPTCQCLETEAIRSCIQEQRGAEFPQSPAHTSLKWKRAVPPPLLHLTQAQQGCASFTVQTQGKERASLPGWRSELPCRQSGSFAGFACPSWQLLPVCGAPAHGAGQACAVRLLEKLRVPRLGMLG